MFNRRIYVHKYTVLNIMSNSLIINELYWKMCCVNWRFRSFVQYTFFYEILYCRENLYIFGVWQCFVTIYWCLVCHKENLTVRVSGYHSDCILRKSNKHSRHHYRYVQAIQSYFKRQITVQANATDTQYCMQNLKLSFTQKIIFRDLFLITYQTFDSDMLDVNV